MADSYDTGMDLLVAAADVLDVVACACEEPADADDLAALATRIRAYLGASRPTTTLGMPRITSQTTLLSAESARRRSGRTSGHVRIVST